MRGVRIAVLMALVFAAGGRPHAQAQTPLAHVRDLYSNAAYEEVLSAAASDPTASPEIGQYRVFSLIALGRPAEAEKAVEAVLHAHLGFQPDSDASPRLLELFATVRRRIAPDLLKVMYVAGKDCLDRKDRDGAITAFSDVLSIAGSPDLKDDRTVAELQLLARGFLDLSKALPVPALLPLKADGLQPPSPAASTPRSVPAPPAVSTPPVVIQEVLPPWQPPATLSRAEFRGRIHVHISADGTVDSVEMLAPVHPLYDSELLRASKSWTYKPGLSNGRPVPSDRVVEVVLKPRSLQPE